MQDLTDENNVEKLPFVPSVAPQPPIASMQPSEESAQPVASDTINDPVVDEATEDTASADSEDVTKTDSVVETTEDTASAETEDVTNADSVVETTEDTASADSEDVRNEDEDDNEDTPVNDDDSAEKADEVGVGEDIDAFGREILAPVFENNLRMSKNAVKYAYSKIKNTILSYKGATQRYRGEGENFYSDKETVFRFEVAPDALVLFCALDPKSDYLPASASLVTDKKHASTPVCCEIRKETEQDKSSLKDALNLIERVFDHRKTEKKEHYAPVAYAERYPVNPQAVIRGKQQFPPIDNFYDDDEYAPISGELAKDIVQELMGEDFHPENLEGKEKLDALRQQAATVKGAIAIAEPIVYFYDSALNADNTINFVNVQLVLNDRFMGKVLPQQYFGVAEGSDRVEKLNLIVAEQMIRDIDDYPQYTFCAEISYRTLIKKTVRERLLKTVGDKGGNLIFSLDAALLAAGGKDALDAVNECKEHSVRIMLDNTENAGVRLLTEYPVDYLRLDARYYTEGNVPKTAHLDILSGYARLAQITACAVNVENTKEAKFFLSHNVSVIQGFGVCEPKRLIYNATKEIKRLPLQGGN